jgi:hypothetical protein
MICEDDYADTRGSMSSATTHRFTNRSTSKNIWEHGTIASKSISSQPTRRKRTRSNVCGGIFMRRLLATIAVQPWRNWPHSPVNGSPPITTTMRTCGTLLRSQHSAPVNLWSYLVSANDFALFRVTVSRGEVEFRFDPGTAIRKGSESIFGNTAIV